MTDILLALQITALGMGLVFGIIVLLWLMMILLTYFTSEKEVSTDLNANHASDASETASVSDTGFKAQAAAIAVAIALAEPSKRIPEPPTAIVSAWQLGMRTSQRAQKGNFRRR